MKRILHKLPLPILAGLSMVGCAGNRSNKDPEPTWDKIDTVYVLNTHPATYRTYQLIWATDKSGSDFDGAFILPDGVVFPQTGDVVVLGSHSPLGYYTVIKNITAEKRKKEYMKTK